MSKLPKEWCIRRIFLKILVNSLAVTKKMSIFVVVLIIEYIMFNYFNKVMKKIILFAAILCGMGAAQAQSVGHVYGNKATDNWSFTLKGGAVSPFQHYAFFKNARGIFGAELRKQVTPVLGLGVEGE